MDDGLPAVLARQPGLTEEVVNGVQGVPMREPKLLTIPPTSGAFEEPTAVQVTGGLSDRDWSSRLPVRRPAMMQIGYSNGDADNG
jgi:hypothetical protein